MNQTEQMRALIDAAEEDSKNYEDDPRPDVRCDVMNAFFRGANWQKKQALSHVNETPKNEHDSDDVLKPAKLVRLTFEQIEDCFPEKGCYSRNEDGALVVSVQWLHDFAKAIMTAMERANQ